MPEWFKNKEYSKNLSATGWYREIRRRQSILKTTEFYESYKGLYDLNFENLINLWLAEPNPNALAFYLPTYGMPVQPLSVFETLYLRAAIVEDSEIELIDEKLRNLLKMWNAELNRKDAVVHSLDYEATVRDFIKLLDENDKEDKKYLRDLEKVCEGGNPFLSYWRPLNGFPLTIDTQFDDQTILEGVKS